MAWVFPGGKLPDGSSIVNIEDFNLNLLPYVNEFNGRLNEHNLSDDLATDLTVADDFTSGTAWRLTYITDTNDGDDFHASSGGKSPDDDLYRSFGGWQLVRAMSWAGVIRGTTIYVLASIQQERSDINSGEPAWNGGGSAQTTSSHLGSCRYAVAIDGNIIPESTVGDLDDLQGPWMEHGARITSGPITEALLPITPGYHTIEVWINVTRMPVIQAAECAVAIGRRSMLIWETD